jgi:hypothetical protein
MARLGIDMTLPVIQKRTYLYTISCSMLPQVPDILVYSFLDLGIYFFPSELSRVVFHIFEFVIHNFTILLTKRIPSSAIHCRVVRQSRLSFRLHFRAEKLVAKATKMGSNDRFFIKRFISHLFKYYFKWLRYTSLISEDHYLFPIWGCNV